MTAEPLALSVSVSLNLDENTIIHTTGHQVGEDDWSTESVTLGQRVAELVAEKIATDIVSGLRDSYRAGAPKIVAEKMDKIAADRINSALQAVTQPTDHFGTPKGEPKTIAELIDERITAWFRSSDGNGYGSKTHLQKVLDSAVDARLQSEMNKAVTEAKKKVLDSLVVTADETLRAAMMELLRKASIR